MRLFIAVIGLYLIVALAVPLGLMLAKSLQGSREEFVGVANYVRYFSTPALFLRWRISRMHSCATRPRLPR